jgi:hypothetical protein
MVASNAIVERVPSGATIVAKVIVGIDEFS